MTHRSSAPSVEGFHKLSFWREESVGVISLLSPGLIDNEMMEELIRVFTTAAMDDAVSSLLITGTNYVFSRGIKIPESRNYADLRDFYKRVQSLTLFWVALEKPVFTAINGTATNNGVALALLGDEVFISANSKIVLDDDEPIMFMGSITIPERVLFKDGVYAVRGFETDKESMMERVFELSKKLGKIGFHRARKKKFPDMERILLQEEIDYLDFYLWCEGCK